MASFIIAFLFLGVLAQALYLNVKNIESVSNSNSVPKMYSEYKIVLSSIPRYCYSDVHKCRKFIK